jgi:hypothetical protein
LVNRTLAIFRKAEFGFFGVVVLTFKHTPRLKGPSDLVGRFFKVLKTCLNAGDLLLVPVDFLAFLFSWLIVGILSFLLFIKQKAWHKQLSSPN